MTTQYNMLGLLQRMRRMAGPKPKVDPGVIQARVKFTTARRKRRRMVAASRRAN